MRGAALSAATALVCLTSLAAAFTKQKGANYVTYTTDGYSMPASKESLKALAATGATHTEIVPVWTVQGSWDPSVVFNPKLSPGNDSIVQALEDAISAGLQPILKPHVDCQDGEWRALIGQSWNQGASEWTTFFDTYTVYMQTMAQIAADHGAVGFVVGTELVSATKDYNTQSWYNVIAAVRKIYPESQGWMSYAANWGGWGGPEPWDVQFWDKMDFIGIDAYYPLTQQGTADPPLSALVDAWGPIVTNLTALSEKWSGKPILFTELGYQSVPTAACFDSDNNQQPPDEAAQANAYTAMFQAVWDQDWFAGVHWWRWAPTPFAGGKCDNQWTPQGKQALKVLNKYYGGGGSSDDDASSPALRGGASALSLYSDGSFGSGWSSWSYGGAFNPQDTSDPYPGHTESFQANLNTWGSISISADSPSDVSSMTAVSFNLRTDPVQSWQDPPVISAWACSCAACNGTCVSTRLDVLDYMETSIPCALPNTTSWTDTTVTIPVEALVPGEQLQRLQIEQTGGNGPVSVYIDNVQVQ